MSPGSSVPGARFRDLPSEAWDQLEQIVQRFERDWQQGRRPAIDDYLPPDGRLRQAALVELVHADLECRLKAGEAARVESYLERYTDLASDSAVLVGLLVSEYELRRRREPDVTPDEYV